MRLKAIIIAISLFFICSLAASEASAQGRRGYIGPPIVYSQQTRHLGHHRGWVHKKYTYGYRNYGQYRRTQVGNRRFNTYWRPTWSYRTWTSRYSRRYRD